MPKPIMPRKPIIDAAGNINTRTGKMTIDEFNQLLSTYQFLIDDLQEWLLNNFHTVGQLADYLQLWAEPPQHTHRHRRRRKRTET